MDDISPKERLLSVLKKKSVDRPPVICPGGMMNAAVVDVMADSDHQLPAAHHETGLMSALALDVQSKTGFENFGLPFCMTVEAESLGSEIDFGTLKCEPKIKVEPFTKVAEFVAKPAKTIEKNKRAQAVLETISILNKREPDIPVIGGLTGPMSTAASLVDPMMFIKELRKNREGSHRVLDYVSDELIEYSKVLVEAGADVICIADPTATGEILGPKMFYEYALFYINKIVDALHKLSVPVIVHICGNVLTVKNELAQLHGEALSVDAMVNLKSLKALIHDLTTMGNLSTYTLEFADEARVTSGAQNLMRQNIDILAPACGLSTSTPIGNIQAFTSVVKNGS